MVYQDGFYGADLYVSTHTGAFLTPSPDKPAFFFCLVCFVFIFVLFCFPFLKKYNLIFVFLFPCGYIYYIF